MQMLPETMATAFKKKNEGCFTCGDKNYLKGDYPKKANKTLQEFAHTAIEEYSGSKILNLKLILMENLFQGTPNRGPPGALQQKPGANSIFSLKPSTSSSVAVDIPALNDFFLYPQAVPSRVPTRLFGPLPPQTFSLLFG